MKVLTKAENVTIYSWPTSQICMECVHGEFIQSETFDSSDYRCKMNSKANDGIVCPHYIAKEEESQDEDNS